MRRIEMIGQMMIGAAALLLVLTLVLIVAGGFGTELVTDLLVTALGVFVAGALMDTWAEFRDLYTED